MHNRFRCGGLNRCHSVPLTFNFYLLSVGEFCSASSKDFDAVVLPWIMRRSDHHTHPIVALRDKRDRRRWRNSECVHWHAFCCNSLNQCCLDRGATLTGVASNNDCYRLQYASNSATKIVDEFCGEFIESNSTNAIGPKVKHVDLTIFLHIGAGANPRTH